MVLTHPTMHLTLGAAVPMLLVHHHRAFLVMLSRVLDLRVETLVAELDLCSKLQPGSQVHVDELGHPVTKLLM